MYVQHEYCRRLTTWNGRYSRETVKVKVKQSLYRSGQALNGYRNLRLPDMYTVETLGMSQPYAPAALIPPPRDYSWCLFLLETCAAGRIMSSSTDTIGNSARDFPAWSAVPQQTAPPRAWTVPDSSRHLLVVYILLHATPPDACFTWSRLSQPLMHAAQTVLLAGLGSRYLDSSTIAPTFESQSSQRKRKFQTWNLIIGNTCKTYSCRVDNTEMVMVIVKLFLWSP